MKLAIISDTHDNLVTLGQAIEWIKKAGIDEIIHCGDVATAETLVRLAQSFSSKIHLVFGNMEINPEEMEQAASQNENVIIYGEKGELRLKSSAGQEIKIGFTHLPEPARKMALSGKYDFVFYGHTHQPWEEVFEAGGRKVRLINPGNLAGMFYKATFAVYDVEVDKLELKILEKLD